MQACSERETEILGVCDLLPNLSISFPTFSLHLSGRMLSSYFLSSKVIDVSICDVAELFI